MNNDFRKNTDGNFSSGFDRETSSGFASGSFDSGYSDSTEPMSFNDSDDYGFGKPMSYNDEDIDFSAGKPMSYNDNSNFGASSMNYNSTGSFVGSSFNSQTYDPNAPLYRPETNEYNPNASLYRPSETSFSSGVSSSSSATVTKTNNKRMTIIIVALGLAVLLIVGFVVYNVAFKKKSFKTFLDTEDGKAFASAYKAMVVADDNFVGADVYMEGDDVVVLEGTIKNNSISKSEKSLMETMMKAQEPELRETMKKLAKSEKLNDFKLTYRYKNRIGDILFEYTIE